MIDNKRTAEALKNVIELHRSICSNNKYMIDKNLSDNLEKEVVF